MVGLAVFASDALSSTAYATQEILVVLAAAGTAAFAYAIPIAIAIVVLLVIVTISYEQTIHAYPGGGGAYIVARDNLGELPGADRRRGAADRLHPDRRRLDLVRRGADHVGLPGAATPPRGDRGRAGRAVVMIVNLRGVKESGAVFAIPTYFFVVMMFVTVGVGLVALLRGHAGHGGRPAAAATIARRPQAVTLFLILHAFSSGTTALTGVEAISNGITGLQGAAQPQRRHHADLDVGASWARCSWASPSWPARSARCRRKPRRSSRSSRARSSSGRGLLYLAMIARDHAHPDHGGQHRLCRLPAPGGAAGRRRLPAAPADLPRQPAGLLARHHGPGR